VERKTDLGDEPAAKIDAKKQQQQANEKENVVNGAHSHLAGLNQQALSNGPENASVSFSTLTQRVGCV
jgi:hypothetical protein